MSFKCNICDKEYRTLAALKAHNERIHKRKSFSTAYYNKHRNKNVFKYKCLEKNCESSFPTLTNLTQHLKIRHKSLPRKAIPEIEKNNLLKRPRKTQCCDSQEKKDDSSSQTKIETYCGPEPVVIDSEDKRIKDSKENLQGSLYDEDTLIKILESSDNEAIEECTIDSNEVIKDSKTEFHIDSGDDKIYKNNIDFDHSWIAEFGKLESEANSPVLFYKQQGKRKKGFEESDFCLIIMNDVQESLLTTFGNNIISVDSIHERNNYDFEIITIMIINDHNEAFPVAFMFTNRRDTFVNEVFFQAIEKKVGIVKCKVFISDVTSIFYYAWCSVMGEVHNRLYCSWDVQRIWQNSLAKISDETKKESVYKTITFLQYSVDEDEFTTSLSTFIDGMLEDEDTNDFAIHFQTDYSLNYVKWANCFRNTFEINADKKLESMHKVLEHLYFDGKTVYNLEQVLHRVLKYLRDEIVDILVEYTKSNLKNSYLKDIHERHRMAMKGILELRKKNDKEWIVQNYLVTKIHHVNCCLLSCTFCDICVHAYTCNCLEFLLNVLICNHIHYAVVNAKNCEVQEADTSGVHDNKTEIKSEISENCQRDKNKNITHGTRKSHEIINMLTIQECDYENKYKIKNFWSKNFPQ